MFCSRVGGGGWGVVCVCVSVWEVWRGRCKGRYLPPPSAPGRHSVVWCPLSACSHAKETHSPSLENILLSHARNCLPGRPPGLKEDNPGTVDNNVEPACLLSWTELLIYIIIKVNKVRAVRMSLLIMFLTDQTVHCCLHLQRRLVFVWNSNQSFIAVWLL